MRVAPDRRTTRGPRAGRWRVAAAALLTALALATLTFVTGVARATPGHRTGESVRTGTTGLAARAAAAHALQAPGDAPWFGGAHAKPPPPPASYNTYNGGWIRFSYPPSTRERVEPLIAEADAARRDLETRLGQRVLDRVNVYVARTPGEMTTLAPEGAPYPRYAAGVAYPELRLILLSIAPVRPNSNHNLKQIFKHELAHVALYNAVDGHPVPRWFNEGFAVVASGETSFARLHTLWTATLSNNLLSLKKLDRTFPAQPSEADVAYAEAADVVRYLMRERDHERFAAMIARVRHGETFERALEDAYDTSLASLEYEWRQDVAKRYTFWPVLFSGSVVWAGVVGLVIWGFRRKKRRDKQTLDRWAAEEAREDALERKLAQAEQQPRLHIVFARSSRPSLPELGGSIPESEIPKIEHDGQWHTLH
jgi:Peptidase MA superfamily